MFHKKRIWGLPHKVESLEELAEKLTEYTWTLCTTFEHQNYLYLNDSTSEDGAQEYAIVKRNDSGFSQIESITFGWINKGKAIYYINEINAGKYDAGGVQVFPRIDRSENHRCGLCA